jgi:hypothetical protein
MKIVIHRRLCDDWSENEILLDRNGKRMKHEIWYNIEEEKIEHFKLK